MFKIVSFMGIFRQKQAIDLANHRIETEFRFQFGGQDSTQ